MQTKIKISLVTFMALVMLGIGCAPETSQNNAVSRNNQNASDQNASNQNSSNANAMPPPLCTSVTEEDLKKEINTLPNQLKEQFKEVNPQSGTISMTYANKELTFNGYITGNGNNLRALIGAFDKFRGENCVRVVYFMGENANANFEWRSADNPQPTPNPSCKKDIDDIIKNSQVADQIDKNLFYDTNVEKVLTFSGYIGDAPGRGRFNSLIAQLQQPMSNGCLTKMVFAPHAPPERTAMLKAAFNWQICEGGTVECNGACVAPPCMKKDDLNANPNASTNRNANQR